MLGEYPIELMIRFLRIELLSTPKKGNEVSLVGTKSLGVCGCIRV